MHKSVLLVAALLLPALLPAQDTAGKSEFEVASVKLGSSLGPGVPSFAGPRPGGFVSQNSSLARLIMVAFGLTETQVLGGPSWVRQDGWNIEAKYPANTTQTQMSEMLQGLLANRFRLTYHRETKTAPAYHLAISKGGPRLHASEVAEPMLSWGPTVISFKGGTIVQLLAALNRILQRPVLDETGLTGRYDIQLTFAPVSPDPLSRPPQMTSVLRFSQPSESWG